MSKTEIITESIDFVTVIHSLWRDKKGMCFNLYQLLKTSGKCVWILSNFKYSEIEWNAFNPWLLVEINYKPLIIVDFIFFKGGWD